MFKIWIIAILLYGAFPNFASANEKPELLLFERNPWLMVVGSDSPTFAHYPNGTTIFWEKNEDKGSYKIVKLNAKEKKDLLSKATSLYGLKKKYSTINFSDQTTFELHFPKKEKMEVISVYGPIKKRDDARKKVPEEFLHLFDHMVSFKHPEAKKWIPEFLEVMVWPYSYAPEESIVWPSSWPDTKSTSTIKRSEIYSIYLPYDKKEEFIRFIKTRNERGAVLINGKKWTVSTRIPFPHEIEVNQPDK